MKVYSSEGNRHSVVTNWVGKAMNHALLIPAVGPVTSTSAKTIAIRFAAAKPSTGGGVGRGLLWVACCSTAARGGLITPPGSWLGAWGGGGGRGMGGNNSVGPQETEDLGLEVCLLSLDVLR